MNLDPLDTTPEARERQANAHTQMGPEGRLRAALELSETVRAIRLDGLRSKSPEASEIELIRRFIAETHGVTPELAV